MSAQFYAIKLFVTTKPATAVDHNGVTFMRDDIPVGSVIAMDVNKDVFLYRRTSPHLEEDVKTDLACWPQPVQGHMQLFRDYWMLLSSRKEWHSTNPDQVSPFVMAARNAVDEPFFDGTKRKV